MREVTGPETLVQHTSDMPIVRLDNVAKSYVDGPLRVDAIKAVNLCVRRGEFVVVMGPSGSGKSTLLHILGCLDRPTQGRYRFDGDDVSLFPDRKLALTRNKRIGFVFQTFNLLVRETALENVALPLLYSGANRATSRAREALAAVGLGQRMGHRPGQLSGGEQQRVAIARAMVKQPDLILADEPTGNLDSRVGSQIIDLFRQMHQNGMTIILITHNPEIAAVGDRVLHIRDGEVTEEPSA
jgi:putative ABC transport system ATP-binding protein